MPAPSGRQGGVGKYPRQKEPAAAGRAERGCPQSQHLEASFGAPTPELLTFSDTSFFVLRRTSKVLFPSFALLHVGLKNSLKE